MVQQLIEHVSESRRRFGVFCPWRPQRTFRNVEGTIHAEHIFAENDPNGQQVSDPEPRMENPS